MKTINVADHLGLAHLACKAFKVHAGRGFCYEDLVQAACEGLLYAAASFDPALGKFSTYAVPMAKKFVKRLVATQARTVKCPEYTQDRTAAQGRATRPAPAAPRERRTTGGPFDWDSAPAATRPAALKVAQVPYAGVPASWTAASADPWDVPRDSAGVRLDGQSEPDTVHAPGAELSFDFVRPDTEGESTMHDYMTSDGPTPEDIAAARERTPANPRLHAAIQSELNATQKIVVAGRLLGYTGPMIGLMLGVSKERVRQIQNDATARLRTRLGT